MITSLSIENYALIEKLDISFSSGFTTITGETGAGKSILLGALGLVLGKRADLSSLKNKDEKCVIEAHFDIQSYNLNSFFDQNDLDFENQTIIRREILSSGKSRAFVNDTPVNLNELQNLGTFLIDIHSQQQTQELSETDYQFAIIDAIAGNINLLAAYTIELSIFKKIKSDLKLKSEQLQKNINEQEYDSFLLNELLQANLRTGEQEILEIEFEKSSNVELIKENISKSISISNEEQFGVISSLNEIKICLQKIASFSKDYKIVADRLTSVAIEFDDIQKELQQLSESIVSDPETLERTNQKLQVLYMLQKKHQVATVDALLEIQEQLDSKVVSVATLENEIEIAKVNLSKSEQKLNELAVKINENRSKSIPILIEKITAILVQLGMPNARFDLKLEQGSEFFYNGKDNLQFLFSANKGSDFGILKKVASGGELSRIMLAVKAILAQYSKLPTLIFDEIDTGVSGEIAIKMGDIMSKMSQSMQIFAITHLPQIAAKGNEHFKVFKTTQNNTTFTQIQKISNQDRVLEIAQMLSGTSVSESATNHAKELLQI